MHVNEYRPHRRAHKDENENPDSPGATIIFVHGLGSTKESYEPFFADLLSNPLTPPIHAIWAPDLANHGQSFRLNEDEIGDERHLFDGAHDIMQLINHFHTSMTLPLIGIGQSWGCVNLLLPAAWHPRIFQGIALMEPVLETGYHHAEELKTLGVPEQGLVRSTNLGFAVALMSDRWESREAAERHMRKSKYYSQFDPRALAQTLRYGLRDMPDGSVTLATPRYQQAQLFMRAAPPMKGYPAGKTMRRGPRRIISHRASIGSPIGAELLARQARVLGDGWSSGKVTGRRAQGSWEREEQMREEPAIDAITVPPEWVERISKL
ncbi:hypothetical protein ACJ73_04277 [Blastomyces percursus]|uniref:AB hydrolase-1 domain-containing protein n=1 Tax=Blastomyces percursus TaxID=1658174 RepID=A0A1J9QVV4_9EURO|nr:hypothetical protein ACJ73_04277 [Blastomyces percursus]